MLFAQTDLGPWPSYQFLHIPGITDMPVYSLGKALLIFFIFLPGLASHHNPPISTILVVGTFIDMSHHIQLHINTILFQMHS
jgi:hypothetical protein